MIRKIADQYRKIIDHYGADHQIMIAMEELAELVQALSKYQRDPSIDNHNHVLEEVADVRVMLDQLMLIFDKTSDVGTMAEIQTNEIMLAKIQRQLRRIREENNGHSAGD